MENVTNNNLTEKTKKYYDSNDANSFYYNIWGGEDIHIGIYEEDSDSIFDASRKTVSTMGSLTPILNNQSKVLDIGSGFGGSARFLAKKYKCKVECLNLSEVQNAVNRILNKNEKLENLISVTAGNFEELPYEAQFYDVVWCQDAILHSKNRQRVLQEVYRVLKHQGMFILTDPMQSEDSDQSSLRAILDRIHLDSLSTVSFYRENASSIGFRDCLFEDKSKNLEIHYTKVLEDIERKEASIKGKCSTDYIKNMKKGLRHWIEGGKSGDLCWGIFRFTKPCNSEHS
ncbi:MAG: cyclopropane-fatty-acyl-phospholipid synthase family protein [Oligoflexales bacterium]